MNYSDAGYAESLSEFGVPRRLPRSGGWLLERPVPDGSARDLVGPYPLFSCADWSGLAADLDELEGTAVSVVVVADPLSGVGEPELRRAFPDHLAPFKRHHLRDLDRPDKPPAHHRRHIRRASEAVEVEVCAEPLRYLDDWVELYAGLVERHGRKRADMRPVQDFHCAVEMLDHRRAAFHPVSAIDVGQSEVIADHGMMDIPANDAVNTAPPRLGGERVLILSDELDRVLDFQLRPFGQGPIGQPERSPDRVEIGVEPDRSLFVHIILDFYQVTEDGARGLHSPRSSSNNCLLSRMFR